MRSKKPASTYSPALKREVPSAQVGLTSLFEMVRGGPNRHRHRKPLSAEALFSKSGGGALSTTLAVVDRNVLIENVLIVYIEYNRSSEFYYIISLRVISTTWL